MGACPQSRTAWNDRGTGTRISNGFHVSASIRAYTLVRRDSAHFPPVGQIDKRPILAVSICSPEPACPPFPTFSRRRAPPARSHAASPSSMILAVNGASPGPLKNREVGLSSPSPSSISPLFPSFSLASAIQSWAPDASLASRLSELWASRLANVHMPAPPWSHTWWPNHRRLQP